MELRTCKICEEHKPVAEFYARNGNPYSSCKRCICEANKRARAARARPKVNLVGERFGDLVVLAKVPPCLVEKAGLDRRRGTAWLCACACGQATYLHTARLTSGNTKSCGCGKHLANPENVKRAHKAIKISDRTEAMVRRVSYTYRRNAEKRGYSFCLPKDKVRELLLSDCHYCGSPPSNVLDLKHQGYKYADGKPDMVSYNGIDRVDNAKGYEPDNVVSCCKLCNQAKMNLSLDEFRDWVRRVYNRVAA